MNPVIGSNNNGDSQMKIPPNTMNDDYEFVLQAFRLLTVDLCEQFEAGHPGSAMGMAAIGVALFKYTMKYAPRHPRWFNRDRFLLSNGHACLFQYINLHLTGYPGMTFEDLKSYRSGNEHSLCPGHPEIEYDGISLTTGPLGQGIANAVGLAMATKHLAATYNRPGFEVVNNHTFCIVGDACQQEGVGCEAFSYAGHLKLNNLTVIYDNNQITCDGSVDMTNTENVNQKMQACGWDTIDIADGVSDVKAIVDALEKGKDPTRVKPLFINVRTVIGVDSVLAGKAAAHGSALGPENTKAMKIAYGWDPKSKFVIPEKVRNFYADLPDRGDMWVTKWERLVSSYKETYPALYSEFRRRIDGSLPDDWKKYIPHHGQFTMKDTSTRKANSLVMSKAFENVKNFMVGTADLTPSVNLTWDGYEIFNPPDLQPTSGASGSYAGQYIHFGIREHAMAAIANGLAAYSPGTIIPVTSSFLMFYLYAAAGVRMGALQNLRVIHVATHDSIGMGDDGPTHQPVELAALFRAMPNLAYIRPGDSEEVAGAWLAAVEGTRGPSMLSLSRHAIPQTGITSREGVLKGAYVIQERQDAKITLIGVGSELSFAIDLALALTGQGIITRVVSFPCHALFNQQSLQYQQEVLRRHEGIPAVVIEPFVSLGWERWTDAGFNMKGYGHSLPLSKIYDHFGFSTENMTRLLVDYLKQWESGRIPQGHWTEFL